MERDTPHPEREHASWACSRAGSRWTHAGLVTAAGPPSGGLTAGVPGTGGPPAGGLVAVICSTSGSWGQVWRAGFCAESGFQNLRMHSSLGFSYSDFAKIIIIERERSFPYCYIYKSL